MGGNLPTDLYLYLKQRHTLNRITRPGTTKLQVCFTGKRNGLVPESYGADGLSYSSQRKSSMEPMLQKLSWFFAAVILPRRMLAVFERLPLSVLCYLRISRSSNLYVESCPEITALLEQIFRFERLFKQLQLFKFLSLSQVCKVHAAVFFGTGAGVIRRNRVSLIASGEYGNSIEFRPPEHKGLHERVSYLLQKYNNESRDLYRATKFFWDFVNIHPFNDGNGRVARLVACFGLDDFERCAFNLFCAESMFNFKLKFADALRGYQCSGDYSELGAICQEEIQRAREKVSGVEQVCDDFNMRLNNEGVDAGLAAEFIKFPVQPLGDTVTIKRVEQLTSETRDKSGTDLGRLEINGSRFIVAQSILDVLECLRPYRNTNSFSVFEAK